MLFSDKERRFGRRGVKDLEAFPFQVYPNQLGRLQVVFYDEAM